VYCCTPPSSFEPLLITGVSGLLGVPHDSAEEGGTTTNEGAEKSCKCGIHGHGSLPNYLTIPHSASAIGFAKNPDGSLSPTAVADICGVNDTPSAVRTVYVKLGDTVSRPSG
jgi:hypothetical protein